MHIPEIDQPIVDDGIAGIDYLTNGIRNITVKILKTDIVYWKSEKMPFSDFKMPVGRHAGDGLPETTTGVHSLTEYFV